MNIPPKELDYVLFKFNPASILPKKLVDQFKDQDLEKGLMRLLITEESQINYNDLIKLGLDLCPESTMNEIKDLVHYKPSIVFDLEYAKNNVFNLDIDFGLLNKADMLLNIFKPVGIIGVSVEMVSSCNLKYDQGTVIQVAKIQGNGVRSKSFSALHSFLN